jgi:hypothetical protein
MRLITFSTMFALVVTSALFSQDFSKVVIKNERKIEIDYLKEKDEKFSKVELYYTTNDGESWKLYGDDKDVMPPFEFTAPTDGYYGFKIVTYDKNGNNVGVPDNNTLIEVPYFFDTIKPKITLKSPTLGEIWKVGEAVNIQWYATDDKQDLPKDPISISYSLDKGHTWEVLFNRHPNTGVLEKSWVITDLLISSQLLIKISVIDQAKNYSEVISEPIQVISKNDKIAAVYHVNLSDRTVARKYWESGNILADREEYYDALLQLHKAIQFDPTKSMYHHDMAIIYSKIGDAKKAEEKFLDAIKIAEDRNATGPLTIKIYTHYIEFLHKLKEVNKEKAMIDAILKIDKDNETALWYLALLYEERKNIDAAKEIWGIIALSERNKPDGSEFPEYSIWRISAKEKLMKYVDQ